MSQCPYITLPLKHIQTFVANPISIVTLPHGEILLNFAGQSLITKLDADLAVIWKKDIQHMNTKLSASPDGTMIAIAGTSHIQILNADTTLLHSIEHLPWGRSQGAPCYFSSDNKMIWYIIPGDELQVMNATTFELIATCPLFENQQYAYIFHSTPDPDTILLEATAGQEESILVQVQLKDNIISQSELPQCEGIMGNFAPSGKEFVMAPHYDGRLKIYSFPEIALIAEVEQVTIFENNKDLPSIETDNINYTVLFIDNNNILIVSQFGRLLLLNRNNLQAISALIPAGITATAYDLLGNPTTNPAEIYDYNSNIISVMIVHDQLLLTTTNGELRTYDLPVG